MSDLITVFVYIAALMIFSILFHKRFGCLKASVLAGIVTAAITVFAYIAIESQTLNPAEYIAGLLWFGAGPAILAAILSSLIGTAIQLRK